MTKVYKNANVAVVWDADLCSHCGNCINGLPTVFNLAARPWINVDGATPQQVIDQVSQCPTGAITMGNPCNT